MSKRLCLTCFLACLVYLSFTLASAEALVRSYVEDFSTPQYCDTLNTTAWWDTVAGEVKLPPFELTLAGSYDTPDWAYGVAVSGDYAYVTDYGSGLQVIDISDPTSPVLAGSYDTPGAASGVAISGDYAYVADRSSGLQVIDISDPTSPVLAGSYETPDYAWAVALSGDYAYVANNASGLQVIDISNPTAPTLAGSYDTPNVAFGVALSGDYAYVADRDAGLRVIDISDPTDPTFAGSYDTPGAAYGVAISGDYAYVGDGGSLQVIDISDPTDPALAGSYGTPNWAYRVAISGDYAYVGNGDWGLRVIDISDPRAPTFAGSYDTPDWALAVAISGDYAYVADVYSGLQVIDISDPTSPALVGSYDTAGMATVAAISGDCAYVADLTSGLQVIDISDPTSPVLAGSYDTPDEACGVAISGDHAYVADGYSGLQIIAISDPTTPVLAGSYNTPGYARGVAISGDYAYVADEISGLQVIDISDPTTPTLARSYDTPDVAYGVAISGDYAYVGDGGSGLQVIDISDPTDPTFAGSYDTPGAAYGVAISGDYAYVGDYDWGLQVIEVFQRRFDTDSNTAWSLSVDGSDDTVFGARLSSTQTDSIRWEVSADSGGSWQEFLPGGDYQNFISPGSNLIWRSSHFYTGPGINPACSNLKIEWLYSFGMIDSIVDVPRDQGGWARIHFTRSGRDLSGDSLQVVEYYVWCRIDDTTLAARIRNETYLQPAWLPPSAAIGATASLAASRQASRTVATDGRTFLVSESFTNSGFPPGTWEVVGSVPGIQQDHYITRIPTLGDSTAGGIAWSVHCISAHTGDPSVWYVSPPDSGYSIDNFAPSPPSGLMMASAADLAWDECPDDDFNYFTVYGSAAPGLDTTAVLIGYTIETAMDVTGDQHNYYHVTATDFAGNEGDASTVENQYAGVRVGTTPPEFFALKPNRPNPFESSTVISFDLPKPCPVRLEVVDVRGRVVRVLTDEAWPAGRHSVTWSGESEVGEVVGPGVYFVRIQAGGFTARHKMLRMK